MVDGAGEEVDWNLTIKRFAELETRLPFVAVTLARNRYGFTQEVIDEGIKLGIFQTHKVPKAGQEFPTTALRLDRDHALVMVALAKGSPPEV